MTLLTSVTQESTCVRQQVLINKAVSSTNARPFSIIIIGEANIFHIPISAMTFFESGKEHQSIRSHKRFKLQRRLFDIWSHSMAWPLLRCPNLTICLQNDHLPSRCRTCRRGAEQTAGFHFYHRCPAGIKDIKEAEPYFQPLTSIKFDDWHPNSIFVAFLSLSLFWMLGHNRR